MSVNIKKSFSEVIAENKEVAAVVAFLQEKAGDISAFQQENTDYKCLTKEQYMLDISPVLDTTLQVDLACHYTTTGTSFYLPELYNWIGKSYCTAQEFIHFLSKYLEGHLPSGTTIEDIEIKSASTLTFGEKSKLVHAFAKEGVKQVNDQFGRYTNHYLAKWERMTYADYVRYGWANIDELYRFEQAKKAIERQYARAPDLIIAPPAGENYSLKMLSDKVPYPAKQDECECKLNWFDYMSDEDLLQYATQLFVYEGYYLLS